MDLVSSLTTLFQGIFEPRREKTGLLHMRKQRRRSASLKLISAFVFATEIVRSLFFLNLKFNASSHLLWLYSLVCVGPGRKPRRPVFSQRGSYQKNVPDVVSSTRLLVCLVDTFPSELPSMAHNGS